MQENIDAASDDTTTFRVKMLDPLCLHLPQPECLRRVGIRDDLRGVSLNKRYLLVLEERVRDRDDLALLEERPADERPPADHLLRDVLNLAVLVGVVNVNEHRLVPAFGAMDIDTMRAQ